MNNLSCKIGYWASISLVFSFIIWLISFVGIAFTSPLFIWSNLQDYLLYVKNHNQFFQHLARLFMLMFGPLFVVFLSSFYELVPVRKQLHVRLGIYFALAFAILSSLHYFVQLSMVRMNILQKTTAGLESFIQANPYSFSSSINMLGWTLFLGISSAFMAQAFAGSKLQVVIRYAFIGIAVSCLMSGIGYLFRIDIMTFFFINIGVGGALLTLTIASSMLFKSLDKFKKD
jgi:hypothetical protein